MSILNAITSGAGGVALSGDTSGNLTIQSAGTNVASFVTTGDVGIGTTTPFVIANKNLTVNGTSSAIQLGVSGTRVGQFYSQGTEVRVGSVTSIPMTFYTGDTEQMRIDSSGNVIMGNTSYDYSANGFGFGASNNYSYFTRTSGYALLVNLKTTTGAMQSFTYNGSGVGNVSTNGSNCTFNSTSDYRLKQNVQPMTGALAKVALLKPVTYNWIRENQAGEGFIAHELQEVVPEAVVGTKDAVDADGKPIYQAIDQSVLVATLTAAIQELNAKVDAQAAEIAALKGA